MNNMLVNCSVDSLENENISYSVTLVPRLQYSLNLLDEIIDILEIKRNDLKFLNQYLKTDFDEDDESHHMAIKLEKTVLFSLDILLQIKKITCSISGVTSIPKVLPSSIPLIRTISAQLFGIFPNCSQKLSELSVHLGSIVLDSATLTKARFDFNQCNEESSSLLNEVKLIVDSKINKQYPNLDFFKLCDT
jgi:hypothetical protein